MTKVRLSVTHHDADPSPVLVAEEFHVDPHGQVLDTPRRRQTVPSGVTATFHMDAGNVLVVRALPAGAEVA